MREQAENNVQRVYGICVGNPLRNDIPQCLVYHPSLAVPEERLEKLRMLPLLFRQNGPYIAQFLEGNYFTNAAKRRITTNLKQEIKDYVHTQLYPEEYTLTESIAESDSTSSTSSEEELEH